MAAVLELLVAGLVGYAALKKWSPDSSEQVKKAGSAAVDVITGKSSLGSSRGSSSSSSSGGTSGGSGSGASMTAAIVGQFVGKTETSSSYVVIAFLLADGEQAKPKNALQTPLPQYPIILYDQSDEKGNGWFVMTYAAFLNFLKTGSKVDPSLFSSSGIRVAQHVTDKSEILSAALAFRDEGLGYAIAKKIGSAAVAGAKAVATKVSQANDARKTAAAAAAASKGSDGGGGSSSGSVLSTLKKAITGGNGETASEKKARLAQEDHDKATANMKALQSFSGVSVDNILGSTGSTEPLPVDAAEEARRVEEKQARDRLRGGGSKSLADCIAEAMAFYQVVSSKCQCDSACGTGNVLNGQNWCWLNAATGVVADKTMCPYFDSSTREITMRPVGNYTLLLRKGIYKFCDKNIDLPRTTAGAGRTFELANAAPYLAPYLFGDNTPEIALAIAVYMASAEALGTTDTSCYKTLKTRVGAKVSRATGTVSSSLMGGLLD